MAYSANKLCRLLPAISVATCHGTAAQRWQQAIKRDTGRESRFLPAFNALVRGPRRNNVLTFGISAALRLRAWVLWPKCGPLTCWLLRPVKTSDRPTVVFMCMTRFIFIAYFMSIYNQWLTWCLGLRWILFAVED